MTWQNFAHVSSVSMTCQIISENVDDMSFNLQIYRDIAEEPPGGSISPARAIVV